MDVETIILIVAGIIGTITAVLHLIGWLPKAYTRRLEAVQVSAAKQIGLEVRNALDASLDRQRALAEQDMLKAQAAMTAEAEKAEKSLAMSGVRALGVDKAQMRELNEMAIEGILGPILGAVEMWNPAWADRLRGMDPALLMRFIESPFFKQQVLPRLQPFLSKFTGGSNSEPSSDNPFLGDLKR